MGGLSGFLSADGPLTLSLSHKGRGDLNLSAPKEFYSEKTAVTGAWSEAPCPLRVSRSMCAPVQRAAKA